MKRFGAITVLMCILIAVNLSVGPSRAVNLPIFERSIFGAVKANGVTVTATWTSSTATIGTLEADQRVIVVGRNVDSSWLRIQSYLGYGYVPTQSISLRGELTRVPVVEGDLPTNQLPAAVAPDDPQKNPVLPVISDYARAIYQRGLKLGNRPEIFTKVGDCMSADLSLFLGPFGSGSNAYDLGKYQSLKGIIDYYNQLSPRKGAPNSFLMQSFASHTGFNVSSVEDPVWADPKQCTPDSSPLICEYKLTKPSIALLMFGTNDIQALAPLQFDFYLRLVVSDSIDHGVIPVLNTFPGDPQEVDRANLLNQIIVQVGHDYDVPMINLWLALQPLPGHGRNPDSVYLSWAPHISVAFFVPQNLVYGHTTRNLVTLQTLDRLWQAVILAH